MDRCKLVEEGPEREQVKKQGHTLLKHVFLSNGLRTRGVNPEIIAVPAWSCRCNTAILVLNIKAD